MSKRDPIESKQLIALKPQARDYGCFEILRVEEMIIFREAPPIGYLMPSSQ